jgi:hypothetical protein
LVGRRRYAIENTRVKNSLQQEPVGNADAFFAAPALGEALMEAPNARTDYRFGIETAVGELPGG